LGLIFKNLQRLCQRPWRFHVETAVAGAVAIGTRRRHLGYGATSWRRKQWKLSAASSTGFT